MMSSEYLPRKFDLGSDSFVTPSLAVRPLAYIVTAFMFLLVIYSTASQRKAKVPELNPPKSRIRVPGYVGADQAQDFARNSKDLMVAGRAKFPDQPYRLYSYLGDAVIIPPNLINEIRNEPSLDFQNSSEFVSQWSRRLGGLNRCIAKLDPLYLGLPWVYLWIRGFYSKRKTAYHYNQTSDKSSQYVVLLIPLADPTWRDRKEYG